MCEFLCFKGIHSLIPSDICWIQHVWANLSNFDGLQLPTFIGSIEMKLSEHVIFHLGTVNSVDQDPQSWDLQFQLPTPLAIAHQPML